MFIKPTGFCKNLYWGSCSELTSWCIYIDLYLPFYIQNCQARDENPLLQEIPWWEGHGNETPQILDLSIR